MIQENTVLSAEVFKDIYRKYSGMIYAFILKRCTNQELAEEVAQEAFCRAWQNREKYNQDYRIDNWIIGIALNVLKEKYRHSKKTDKEINSEHMDRIAETANSEALSDDQLLIILQMAVETLSGPYRRAFELVRLEGKSYRQAASIEGISRDALAQRVRRATITLSRKINFWRQENILSLSSLDGQYLYRQQMAANKFAERNTHGHR